MSNGDSRPREFVLTAGLLFVLAVAAWLRFWNLTAELPYAISADEPQIVEHAVTILRTGSFHPHFFDYPSLYIYVQFLVALGRFLMGASLGQYAGLSAFDSIDLYPWARACSATLGVVTVAVTFVVGRHYGKETALAGATLLAILPTHARESHFALVDIPLTLLVTVTWLATLRALAAPTIKAFVLAGAVSGLAAATKYNGAVSVMLPLAAAVGAARGPRFAVKAAAAICCAALVCFVIAAPYSVLDLPAFLDRFATLNREYFVPRSAEPSWLQYLKHLRVSFQWPGLLLVAAGIVLACHQVTRGPRRMIWLLPLLIIGANYWLISSRTIVYARYLLPMAPALCLLGGLAFVDVSRRLIAWRPGWPSTTLVIGLAGLIVTAPLANTVAFGWGLGRPTTQREAYEWLHSHVPRGTPLAIEDGVLRMPMSFYPVKEVKRLTDVPLATFRATGIRYLIASSDDFARRDGSVKRVYGPYFVMGREVFAADPAKEVAGPEIRIYDIAP
jgi:4-amino-4-deoxy-L-arabinose transferase-like glycosyltransferase